MEEVALRLFANEGYSGTTIEELAAASGVSKTTFFRYFRSKADVVWGVFDRHIDRLRAVLAASDNDVPTMTAVRVAVVNALSADTDEYGLWLTRFRLFDTSEELQKEALVHWYAWAMAVAGFVSGRIGQSPETLEPAVVGSAVQAAFVAELRSWIHLSAPPAELVAHLDAELGPLCDALQHWLDREI